MSSVPIDLINGTNVTLSLMIRELPTQEPTRSTLVTSFTMRQSMPALIIIWTSFLNWLTLEEPMAFSLRDMSMRICLEQP